MTAPYGATILEHFRRPRNQRTLARPTASHEAYNPLCGDRVRIEVAVDRGAISEAAFTANACAICTASASLLTERVTGMSAEHASTMPDADLVAALGSELPSGRLDCAILPMTALRNALRAPRPRLEA
jgi:nitrogen fixation NifU-like protein